MDRDGLAKLLNAVRAGTVDPTDAMRQLQDSTSRDIGFATLDLQRAVRNGFPEVVYGPGKTDDQIVQIVKELRAAGQAVLVTRVESAVHEEIVRFEPRAEYHVAARAIVIRQGGRRAGRRGIVVVTAGTADIPVADEAALTAELMGNRVTRVNDVGIAGIHRLLEHRETLSAARVIVAVAGMDGVLPAVVAGLMDCPVIGVPTSTGYGVGGKGEAALLTMLNSCAAGLTVVNIDNGFGAGFAAALINRARKPHHK